MKLSSAKRSDCELMSILLRLPIRERTRLIEKYLHPTSLSRLTEHAGRFINKVPSHILENPEHHRAISGVVKPHKHTIDKFVKKNRSKKRKKLFQLKNQKGGALFSLIIGGILPLLADLIIRQVT